MPNNRRVWKIRNLQPVSRHISQTVQLDKTKVTIND